MTTTTQRLEELETQYWGEVEKLIRAECAQVLLDYPNLSFDSGMGCAFFVDGETILHDVEDAPPAAQAFMRLYERFAWGSGQHVAFKMNQEDVDR